MKKIKYLCQGAALKFYLLHTHTHRHEISYSPPARPVQPHTRRQIPCICKETWRRKWQMSPVDAQHTDTLTPPHPSTSHLVNLRASLCNWHHQIFPSHLSLSSFHFSPPLPTLVPALHSSAIETFTEKKKKDCQLNLLTAMRISSRMRTSPNCYSGSGCLPAKLLRSQWLYYLLMWRDDLVLSSPREFVDFIYIAAPLICTKDLFVFGLDSEEEKKSMFKFTLQLQAKRQWEWYKAAKACHHHQDQGPRPGSRFQGVLIDMCRLKIYSYYIRAVKMW